MMTGVVLAIFFVPIFFVLVRRRYKPKAASMFPQ
jgi:hypothetical protein